MRESEILLDRLKQSVGHVNDGHERVCLGRSLDRRFGRTSSMEIVPELQESVLKRKSVKDSGYFVRSDKTSLQRQESVKALSP
jgi:hypothetical protein